MNLHSKCGYKAFNQFVHFLVETRPVSKQYRDMISTVFIVEQASALICALEVMISTCYVQ